MPLGARPGAGAAPISMPAHRERLAPLAPSLSEGPQTPPQRTSHSSVLNTEVAMKVAPSPVWPKATGLRGLAWIFTVSAGVTSGAQAPPSSPRWEPRGQCRALGTRTSRLPGLSQTSHMAEEASPLPGCP